MSERDCNADCVPPLRFPRRPGTEPIGAHRAGCPCCGGSPDRVSQDNRPGLSRFNYRIGTYGSIREFLFHQLDRAPALQRWTHRAADDPAVALIEGAAILGDILTFYQETYANEAFLRTAQWRESVADLVRLLGYRLSPAVGGRAIFAFEIKKHDAVTIPAGFPLKATLEHSVKPAEFETVDPITAHPWLGRFNLYLPLEDGDITPSTIEFSISKPEQLLSPVVLKPGERLMIGEAAAAWPTQPSALARAEIVTVESVRDLHGTKIVKIKGNLSRVSPIAALAAYRVGRTFHHFGHNSPPQIVDSSEPVKSTATLSPGSKTTGAETESSIPYLDVPSSRPVSRPSGMFSDPTISRSIKTEQFPLDLELTECPVKVPVVIQARFAYPFVGEASQMFDPLPELSTLVRTIERVATTTMSWGAVSGTVSEITVAGPIHDSIGDGDAAARAAALAALTQAEDDVEDAQEALDNARAAADTARITAQTLAEASRRADADVLDKAAKAMAARADAATMALAAEVAAANLKDNAVDVATETALGSAQTALSTADDAKTKAAAAAALAVLAQTASGAATASAGGTVIVAQLAADTRFWLDPFVVSAYFSALGTAGAVALADGAVIASTTSVGIARAAADATRTQVDTARADAEIARDLAKVDAVMQQRSIDADAAVVTARGLAVTAAGAETSARDIAADAATDAAQAAVDADAAAAAIKPLVDALAAAKKRAASKRIVIETRMYIKDALFHEVTSPLLTLKRASQETALTAGHTLNFKGTVSEVTALKDRRILLERPGEDPAVVNVLSIPAAFNAATAAYPVLHPIALSAPVVYAGFPNLNPITTVFGNLADATEGKTLAEIPIGSGDASQMFQTFKLPKAPLTYHIVAGNSPPETPQLSIYVDGRQWTQVESLFGRDHDARLYIVREDAEGNSWVQFGDGKTGARLTEGVNNVTVVYRLGAGSFGPLKPDTKVQASATLKNLDKVSMLGAVTGGGPNEGAGQARDAAPGKVQSLGRIVSLRDFEAEAAAIPGVAVAGASWQLVAGVPAVEVTVLMETGRGNERDAVAETLNAYNLQRGAGRDPVSVVFGSRMHVAVAVEYALAPTFRPEIVEAAIRRALGVNYARATREEHGEGLFSLRQRRLGEREYASRIAGRVQNVEGVRWARTIAFASLSDDDDPAAIALPASSALDPLVACDSRHILSLFDGHLTLTAVKEAGR